MREDSVYREDSGDRPFTRRALLVATFPFAFLIIGVLSIYKGDVTLRQHCHNAFHTLKQIWKGEDIDHSQIQGYKRYR